ncbi:hypothetical protein [Actinokineospora iranica]|uniref:Uncharacterized protein n=1 Tax=Actinokineospora iranica TaxID=1271860 RepID=A0A1G6V4F9_9PSEU|nr:hypothetical protein [Actinokineospora iranica]SDD48540.1 hypothetical protein SAMN05216174_111243 [Actinokineospora iranica]
MATKSKMTGVLVAAAAVAVVATAGFDEAVDRVQGLFAGGTEVIGDGEYSFMVASEATSKVEKCTAQQVLQDKACDGFRIVVFDAGKLPFIARGISEAWESGSPALLTMNRSKALVNRKAACGNARFKKKFPRTSCDEYPVRHEASFYRVEVEDLHPFSVVAENVKLAAV